MKRVWRSAWKQMRVAGRFFLAAAEAALSHLDDEYAFRLAVRSREPMDDETFWTNSYGKSGIPFEIAAKVRRVYGEQLGHDPLKLRTHDLDPAMGEVGHEMAFEVEEAFSVSISDEEAEQTSGSIDSIVQLVSRKLAVAPPVKSPTEAGGACLAPARRTASSP